MFIFINTKLVNKLVNNLKFSMKIFNLSFIETLVLYFYKISSFITVNHF